MDIELDFGKKLIGYSAQGSHNISLHIKEGLKFGEFLTLFGKSGAGKTTILRILSGLTLPDSGYIKVGEQVWQDGKTFLPPQKRAIGYMFQDYALFPHLSVLDNILFGLENKKERDFANWLIKLMELEPILKSGTHQISGGQAQRVALARALVRKPKILLLDEPLSALDSAMRASLQDEIAKLHYHLNITTLLVSHDIGEIFKLASKIWVLENGKIKCKGNASEIFAHTKLSGKVNLSGEILEKRVDGVSCILKVLCGSEIAQILYDTKSAQDLKEGDKVLIVTKAYNPLLFKIHNPI
ncbi:ABC transporter ATP-binding protein [Helicobacter sp. 23-1046]